MRHVVLATLFTIVAAVLSTPVPAARAEGATARTLPRSVFEDKVRGGWAGQMIGVSFGAPTEFRSNAKILGDHCRSGGRAASTTRSIRTTSTWK